MQDKPYKHPTEPNLVEFEAHGYPCVIRRAPPGHLCGYVIMPPGHPWHGKQEPSVKVHGGVTFAELGRDFVFDNDEPNDKRGLADWWVVGFDCAHGGDCAPGEAERTALRRSACELLGLPLIPLERGVYRDMTYVRQQTEHLAEQAAEATGPCRDRGEVASCA